MPELSPFYILFGLLIASLIAVLSERHDPPQDDHAGEEQQPTDCVPRDVPGVDDPPLS